MTTAPLVSGAAPERRSPLLDPLVLGAAGLALGIVAGDGLPLGGALLAVLPGGAALALVLLLFPRVPARARHMLFLLPPLLGMAAVGALRARPQADVLPVETAGDAPAPLAAIEGTVCGALMPVPAPLRPPDPGRATRSGMVLRDCRVAAGAGPLTPRGTVRILTTPGDRLVPSGARVRATGSLIRARGPRNPGGHDARRLRRRAAVAAVLLVQAPAAIEILEPPAAWAIDAAIDRARAAVLARIAADLSPRAAALSCALLLGVRDGLDPEFRQSVAGTGLIHLLAISGLHIALIVGALRALLGLLLRPRAADICAIGGALGYAALAGAGSPVLRAAVGCAVLLFGRCLGRRPRPGAGLALAACVLLLIDPADLYRPGFQLSFAAVVALNLPPGRQSGTPAHSGRLAAWVADGLAVSLRAAVATAPIVQYHFGTLAPLGPILTVLVAPLFLVTFAACCVHGLVGTLCGGVAFLSAGLTDALGRLLCAAFSALCEIPGATVFLPRPALCGAILLTATSFLLLNRRHAAATLALGLALALDPVGRGPPDEHEIWVLDVGHGQAVLVRSRAGGVVLVDCGSMGRPDVGRRVVLPALDALGVRWVDFLVLSHADADHVNGAHDLLRARRVTTVVHAIRDEGDRIVAHLFRDEQLEVPRIVARAGDVLLDEGRVGMRVRVLAPGPSCARASDNDRSLVLEIAAAGRTLVVPGDIESAGIRALLSTRGGVRCDVLVLPHHGNHDPWLGPLLHAAAPALVIASRSSGFRDPTTPLLVGRVGADLRATVESGAICVRIRTDGTIRAENYLDDAEKGEVTASPGAR